MDIHTKRGVTIVRGANFAITKQDIDAAVPAMQEAAFYLDQEMTSQSLAEQGAAKMAEQYQADIIMTLGKLGAVVCDGGKITVVPSKKVHAIETTGAGDSFIGGTAYALIQGMSLTRACEFATCCYHGLPYGCAGLDAHH